ncbi:hypothetical protein ACGF8D_16765 [Streptomyces massasporeus]|uniref:hypothetical protein n=1 Tax=Streptomyces massasporeus TaxID=67324 RepID=UPI00372376CF
MAPPCGPLFQDYARFELLLRENVGLGDLDHVHDDDALRAHMAAADGDRILRAVPDGMDSLLGKGFGPGTTPPSMRSSIGSAGLITTDDRPER